MSDVRSGRFITFEGGEGVGKSTNIHYAAQWLREHGKTVVITREPGGTPIAETIRNQLLKAHHPETMDDMAELLLVFAARAQHLSAVIRPALARGEWVLCDRFTDSTIAYQGYGRGLNLHHIEQLQQLVQGALNPDCTLLFDAPLALGMARARGRADTLGEQIDRFETEQHAFFERVQHGFQTLAAASDRYRRLDASQPLTQVQHDMVVVLTELLNR